LFVLLLIALALLLPGCATIGLGPPADGIARGPYLQQTRSTSVYVVWRTAHPTTGAVHYGTRSTDERVQRDPTRRALHAVRLTGLSPATSYLYRVRADGETTRASRFTTAKVGSVPFRFGAIGDYGSGAAPEYRNAALLRREAVDFVLTLGDNAYELGLDSEYPRAVFHPFGALMHRVAMWPTLGNHDYGNEGEEVRGTADAYLRNFVLPSDPGRERFYSFRYANAEFLAIDSEVTSFAPGSRQYRWIDATLGRSGACWKIPYFHHPVHAEYVEPTATDMAKLAELQRWLVPLFERHGVKLVLTAHEHNYLRSRPLLGGRRHPRGIVYMLSGGGGGELEPLPARPSPLTASRGRFFHHLLVSVVGRRAEVRAIDTAGRVRDRVRLEC
jgi:acid phosphatase type 7